MFSKSYTTGTCVLWSTEPDEIASAVAAGWTPFETSVRLYVYRTHEPHPPDSSRGIMRLICPGIAGASHDGFKFYPLDDADSGWSLIPNYHRFYTTNTDLAKVMVKYGWTLEGVIGFVDDVSADGHIITVEHGGSGSASWTKTSDLVLPPTDVLWANQYPNGRAEKYDATAIPYLAPYRDANFVSTTGGVPTDGWIGSPWVRVGRIPTADGPGVRRLRGAYIKAKRIEYAYSGSPFLYVGPSKKTMSELEAVGHFFYTFLGFPYYMGRHLIEALVDDTEASWEDWPDRDKDVDGIPNEDPWI